MTQRVFDRVPKFDERSRKFPIRGAIRTPTKLRSYTWRCLPYLDQGVEGACVGHGIAHHIGARPMERPVSSPLAHRVYNRAKQIDEWPGEDYDGTSVLAGLKAAREMGYYNGYRWAFGLDDALLALAKVGPVIIGVSWWTGMQEADDDGYIRPTGQIEGGHCTLVTGLSVPKENVRIHNSWGTSWGRNGDAFMTWEDFGQILADQGECAVPIPARAN